MIIPDAQISYLYWLRYSMPDRKIIVRNGILCSEEKVSCWRKIISLILFLKK